jgi:hypothetical protein
MELRKFIATTIREYLNEQQISWDDYVSSQFDEKVHKYLPSNYFNDYEIKINTKPNFPVLLTIINGFEYRKWKYGGIGVFDNDKQVAFADNGSVQVSSEYQRKGIGVELVHLLKSINPNHKFGNMTPQGWNLMRAYYDKKIKQKDYNHET